MQCKLGPESTSNNNQLKNDGIYVASLSTEIECTLNPQHAERLSAVFGVRKISSKEISINSRSQINVKTYARHMYLHHFHMVQMKQIRKEKKIK